VGDTRNLLWETSNRESGNRVEKVLAAAVLETVEDLVEDAARSREVVDAKEAAEFCASPPPSSASLPPQESYPGTPSTGRVTDTCAANCWSGSGGACDGN
jgi:hypothetical protein